jgi:hypothetical protein
MELNIALLALTPINKMGLLSVSTAVPLKMVSLAAHAFVPCIFFDLSEF